MGLEAIIKLVAETGGTLGLAVFSIWMLNRAHVQRALELKAALELERERSARALERERADQAELVSALNRNTEAWITQTKSMVTVAEAMATLSASQTTTRDHIQDIRMLLAERPCIAPGLADEIRTKKRQG